jgi:hypothetical protein
MPVISERIVYCTFIVREEKDRDSHESECSFIVFGGTYTSRGTRSFGSAARTVAILQRQAKVNAADRARRPRWSPIEDRSMSDEFIMIHSVVFAIARMRTRKHRGPQGICRDSKFGRCRYMTLQFSGGGTL